MKNILLNSDQKKAVDHIEGPLLVLAGAGSGKTRVVTMKIAKLINIGISPEEILAVTFTNKAANEMSSRIKKLTSQNIITCTFHSLGSKILRESIHHLDYKNNFTIYDEENSLKLLKECLNSLQIKQDKAILKKFKFKISACKNDLIDIDDINSMSILSKNEIDVFRLYQNNLKNFNAVDFDDLLYLPVNLFKKNNEILKYYQNKWNFLLIDEYQDTNFAQYNLAKMLSLKHQNICVVGDPDQSIYSFRGARYQNILNFDKDFENSTIIKLEKNYRSTSTILNAANIVIKKNTNRYDKNLYSEQQEGEKIKIFKAYSEQKEASFVVEKIQKYHSIEKINLENISIFYRTNFQSRVFEDILLSKNIPYVIYGGISFYQRKEIKDILAFLSLTLQDSDFISFSRTINILNKGFGKTTLNKLFLISEKTKIPIIQLLKDILQNPFQHNEIKLNLKQRENLKNYLNNIFEFRNLYKKNFPIDDLISHIISKMKYLDYLKQDPETFENRKENVDELILKAQQWQQETQNPLENFLEELTLVSSKIENVKENSLKLMSLHNSKGLEFECVFIVGVEEDLFPHINSKNNLEEIEEERRLFYVGMTRAKKYLYITHSQYRYMWGSNKISVPSRFLKELPSDHFIHLNDVFLEENFDYEENYQKKSYFSNTKKNNLENGPEKIKDKYYPGLKIHHNSFGMGIVQKVYQSSIGTTLDILFETGNITRSIAIKYAKIKIC